MTAVDLATSHAPAGTASIPRAGYRADIDGLRAIAVLAVVATHAGVTGFGGGFVGVDVFFVISGYLTTRNLESSTPASWRGLLGFYGRRMRRTLPALYLIIAATLTAGCMVLLPGELDALAQSAVAALLVVPNILFLTQAGYFDHAAISKPLLHTWSLGVEEQFYLVAPLLPWALRKLGPRGRSIALVILFSAALELCVALQANAPGAAFYLLPARLWEFLTGCLVAERVLPTIRTPWLAESLAGAALLGLAASIGWFSGATAHPSLPTLLPCLATALLIHLGRERATMVGRLLGSPPLAAVGLISYSIYLWHWPALALAQIAGWSLSLLVALPTLLAVSWLSWRFVEGPFRDPASLIRRQAGRLLPLAAGCLAMASLAIVAGRGLPQRFPAEVAAVASYYDYVDRRDFRDGSCFITSKYGDVTYFDRAACLHLAADRPNVLIIGDSHAAHLWAGFKTIFAADNVMQATASGCKPLLDATGKRYCTDLIREVLRDFLPQHRIDTVYLSAAWEPADADGLKATLAYLRPLVGKVIVVGRIPGHTAPLTTLLARSILDHDERPVIAAQEGYSFAVDRLFKVIIPAGEYISLIDKLCPAGRCQVWAALGVPLQFDTDHLTSEGSKVVAKNIR